MGAEGYTQNHGAPYVSVRPNLEPFPCFAAHFLRFLVDFYATEHVYGPLHAPKQCFIGCALFVFNERPCSRASPRSDKALPRVDKCAYRRLFSLFVVC